MDLDEEVQQIQQELVDLKARLEAFEATSKANIEIYHKAILAKLQKSVDSVEGTFQ